MPTALITGGHAGIGLECSKQLAARSRYNLVLAGRSMEAMERAATTLRSEHHVTVSTLRLDTSSLSSVREAAMGLRSMLDSGEVDSLKAIVCNAGGRFDGPRPTVPMGTRRHSQPTTWDIFFSSSYSPGRLIMLGASCSPQVERTIPRQPMASWLAKQSNQTRERLQLTARMAERHCPQGYVMQRPSSA